MSLTDLHRLNGFEVANRDQASFSFGIEEEFFLSNLNSGEISVHTPDELFEAAHVATDGRVDREFLQSQVEVATPPLYCFKEARTEMLYIRRVLAAYAKEHNLAILACGTHPEGNWQNAVQSDKERYDHVMDSLQMIGERNLLCGMHVHVELPDPARRVDIMRRVLAYLPLLLALSTSSPFWHSRPTGLKGYRLAAYDELPRTGIPELFGDTAEYETYVESLVNAGVMPDASHLWWMIRPSVKYPTLELRAPDSCTRVEDALAIAALYRSLIRHLFYNVNCNTDIDSVDRALILENKWRAQRYGTKTVFVTKNGEEKIEDFLEKTLAMVAEDAQILNCEAEIAQCRDILVNGSSADMQMKIYQDALSKGSEKEAIENVINWIIDTTTQKS